MFEIVLVFIVVSVLLTGHAIFFYFLGRYSGHEDLLLKKAKKQLLQPFRKPVPSIIDYVTPEQANYRGSEEEKIDQKSRELRKKLEDEGVIKL